MYSHLNCGGRVGSQANACSPSTSWPHGTFDNRRPHVPHCFADNQALRFKHIYKPAESGSPTSWRSWPGQDREQPNSYIHEQTPDERIVPESFWDPEGSPGSIQLRNPYAHKFRATPAPVAVPVSLPGTEYWMVEALNNYSKDWPSIRIINGQVQVRMGFLAPVDDPKAVPFFFYKGLEQVRFTWGDRVFQLVYTLAYVGVHCALFSFLYSANPSLAIGVGLNWALGKLSIGKWALLLLLASSGKLWLYFTFLVAKLVDAGMAKLFPPVRKFFWANFTIWVIYMALSPSHHYPIPFWPFAPGSYGPIEALK